MLDKQKKYSISEVSKITGYDTHVLRYYENDFDLEIPRTNSNRRYYTYKEIEMLIYIKQLQEKKLTNKQIKLILKSPEILLQNHNEAAISSDFESKELLQTDHTYEEIIEQLSNKINDIIETHVFSKLDQTKHEIINHIDHNILNKKDELLLDNPAKNEKDILICENAKLKMKLKEKSYELAELKDKLRRLDNKNVSFWKRIFLRKQSLI